MNISPKMANECMQRYLASLSIKETQTKAKQMSMMSQTSIAKMPTEKWKQSKWSIINQPKMWHFGQ